MESLQGCYYEHNYNQFFNYGKNLKPKVNIIPIPLLLQ